MSALLRIFSSQRVVASVALFVAMLLWSSSYVALKIAVEVYHPIVMLAGRMAVGVVVLAVGWNWLYKIPFRAVPRRDWLILGLVGLLEPSLYLILEGYAMKFTSASQAGMIVAAQPVFVMLLARMILKERLRRRTAAGFALALWGVLWLCADAVVTESAPNPMLGNILEAMAVLCGALYVIAAKNLSPACSPVLITTAQVVMGLLFFAPMLALPDIPLPTAFPLIPTLAVVYLGVMVSLVSFVLFNYAIARLPAVQTGAFLNLVPLMTLLFGVLVMGDVLTFGQWIACGLVMSGVLLSQAAAGAKPKPDQPTSASVA